MSALIAPFYFVFPGSVWDDMLPDERRLIRRCMFCGWIVYVLVLASIFG